MGTKNEVERVRLAILTVFKARGVQRKHVDRDVYAGRDDPGQWAPKAVATIHCESGIPNGGDNGDYDLIDEWSKVSDLLGDLFCEPINAAVIAVWKA